MRKKNDKPIHFSKPELLAPAGNFEKLEIAVHYGADAVYLAGREFSLRNFSENFTLEGLEDAIGFARGHGVKVYAACNVFLRNRHAGRLAEFLRELGRMEPDAVIMSDPGAILTAAETIPGIPIHLSTQANTTNLMSVRFWEKLGIKRINVARELSLDEIREIADGCSAEIEAFVHGAMCMAFSGRCLLSGFLAKRHANLGECAHPCRWKWRLVEEERPGEYAPILEDDQGAYIFNSKDLCMMEHIPAMVGAGVNSFKIEGRMKSIHYLASVLNVYRTALDSYCDNPGEYSVKGEWRDELASAANRGFCTGFYLGESEETDCDFSKNSLNKGKTFLAKVLRDSEGNGSGFELAAIRVRNKIFAGDAVEIIKRGRMGLKSEILEIYDANDVPAPFAQPGSMVTILLNEKCGKHDLIRLAGFR